MNTILKKIREVIWGKIFVLFFRPLYKIEHARSVWRLVNHQAVKHFKQFGRKTLSPLEKRILKDLKERGLAETTLDELFGNGGELLARLLEAAQFDTKKPRINKYKPYIKDFFDEVQEVSLKNPLIAAALHDTVLTIASNYLGMSPKLQELSLAEIQAVPLEVKKSGSMRWHRDPNDRKLIKMFIYLSDVGDEQGPFTYLLGSNDGNKYAKIFPQIPPAGVYPDQGEVEKKIDVKDLYAPKGKAGSVIFADTSGLHYGGHVTSGHRRMFTAGFLAPKSFLARMVKYEDNKDTVLTPMQKQVLLGSEYLFSREVYKFLRGSLLGVESLGTHITGMKSGM